MRSSGASGSHPQASVVANQRQQFTHQSDRHTPGQPHQIDDHQQLHTSPCHWRSANRNHHAADRITLSVQHDNRSSVRCDDFSKMLDYSRQSGGQYLSSRNDLNCVPLSVIRGHCSAIRTPLASSTSDL